MNFDYYHLKSDINEQLPILDWDGWYGKKLFDYKHPKFTGKYKDTLFFSVTLFRHSFNFRFDFNYGTTMPELAYREYHDKVKQR